MKIPSRDGALGLLLALSRELVLLLARDAVILGDVLGGDPHVDVLEGVDEPVMDHRVDHLRVAHARAEATARHQVGRPRHVLHAAGHDDVRVARPDDLRRQRDGLQAGAAEHVEVVAGTSTGSPAPIAAWRAAFWPSPACNTHPSRTS